MRLPSPLAFLVATAGFASALKFELEAKSKGSSPRCIRNYVGAETLVVVSATVSGHKGDGQRVDIHVCWPLPLR